MRHLNFALPNINISESLINKKVVTFLLCTVTHFLGSFCIDIKCTRIPKLVQRKVLPELSNLYYQCVGVCTEYLPVISSVYHKISLWLLYFSQMIFL